jgi:hypothetical protein
METTPESGKKADGSQHFELVEPLDRASVSCPGCGDTIPLEAGSGPGTKSVSLTCFAQWTQRGRGGATPSKHVFVVTALEA